MAKSYSRQPVNKVFGFLGQIIILRANQANGAKVVASPSAPLSPATVEKMMKSHCPEAEGILPLFLP